MLLEAAAAAAAVVHDRRDPARLHAVALRHAPTVRGQASRGHLRRCVVGCWTNRIEAVHFVEVIEPAIDLTERSQLV